MFDRAGNEIFVGDSVIILNSDYPNFVGRTVTVMNPDTENKIKVSYNNQWQGYYRSVDVLKLNDTEIDMVDFKIKSINGINKLIDDRSSVLVLILKHSDNPNYQNVVRAIKHKFASLSARFQFLQEIDKENRFTSTDWFYLGVIFQAN